MLYFPPKKGTVHRQKNIFQVDSHLSTHHHFPFELGRTGE